MRVHGVGGRVGGYANDRWAVQSDVGRLLAKVRRIPEEDPRQIEGQIRAGWRLSRLKAVGAELAEAPWLRGNTSPTAVESLIVV